MYSMDPEVLKLLRTVFDRATAGLSDDQRTQKQKAAVAARLLSLAASGERDPAVLRAAAERCRVAELAEFD